MIRIGHGYDVHRFAENRKLILGGVEVPYAYGLLGHSDADVLAHAIMDALLGAAALGDIGQHFPDTDDAYKGADSMLLLREVCRILAENGYAIGNIDANHRQKLRHRSLAGQRQGDDRGKARLHRQAGGRFGARGLFDSFVVFIM